jgi:serine/threonine-protein kinase
LLEGTLSVARGDSVLLHVRLRGGKRGDQIWAREYPTTRRQLERLQRQVARDVLDYLRVPLTQSERERLARGRVIDPRANEAYQRGLRMSAAFDPDRFQKSIDAFQEAIRLDPEDPAPYAALGEVYQTMVGPGHIGMSPVEAFRLAREAALRSLQLDSNYAEAHVVLAGVHYMWDWDWAGAEREFVRAIQSNPSSAKAHWQYGGYLRFHGWPDSAIAEQHRARRSDPLSTMILAELSLAYAYAGRSDSAIYWGRRAVDLEPNSAPVRYALGNAYMIAGQHDSAIFQERRAAELNPTFRTRLAEAYAAAGRVAQVDSLLATILEPRLRRVVELRTWLLRGDTDAVIRILERWVENHQPLVGYMRGGPEFEPLCSDPRYQALLKRLNLPPRVPRTKRPTWLAREPIRPSGR